MRGWKPLYPREMRLVAIRRGGRRSGAQEPPLVCGECGCRARHERREALDAAVQADSSLGDAAAVLKGTPEEDDEGRR